MAPTKDELPRMFERFFRAKTSTGIPGTGIGLTYAGSSLRCMGRGDYGGQRRGRGQYFYRFPSRRLQGIIEFEEAFWTIMMES